MALVSIEGPIIFYPEELLCQKCIFVDLEVSLFIPMFELF